MNLGDSIDNTLSLARKTVKTLEREQAKSKLASLSIKELYGLLGVNWRKLDIHSVFNCSSENYTAVTVQATSTMYAVFRNKDYDIRIHLLSGSAEVNESKLCPEQTIDIGKEESVKANIEQGTVLLIQVWPPIKCPQ